MEQKRHTILNIAISITVSLLIIGGAYVFIVHQFNKQNQEIQKRVESIVSTDYNVHSAKPFFLIPHKIDSTGNYVLTKSEIDSIEKYISKYYLKSYHEYYDSVIACKEFSPFLITLNKKDKSGNIVLSPKDVENVEGYINYLTKEVNKAIEQSKAELDNDIDRLNMWVTFWVAIMALVGMVFPYLINNQSLKEAKEEVKEAKDEAKSVKEKADKLVTEILKVQNSSDKAQELANTAKSKVEGMNSTLESLQKSVQEKNDSIDKMTKDIEALSRNFDDKNALIEELNEKITEKDSLIEELNTKAESANELSETANTNSNKALKSTQKQEIAIKHLTAISKLKRLEFYKLSYLDEKDINKYFEKTFSQVSEIFKEYKLDGDVEFKEVYQDLLKDYVFTFHETIRFVDPRFTMEGLENINTHIGNYLETGNYSEIETVITLLDKIVEDLKNRK